MATKIRKRVNLHPGAEKTVVKPPDLLELQRDSFKWFIEEGLKQELNKFSPIKGYEGRFELEFTGKCGFGPVKYSLNECLVREITYSAPLKVDVRLIDKESGEVKSQEVFIGDLPMMTERGTFIINGAERVIVSQLVRSPGAYFRESKKVDKLGKPTFYATIIPDRGSWLEIEFDSNSVIYARINKTRKLPITYLLAAIGCNEKEINEILFEKEFRMKTLEAAPVIPKDQALLEIYKRLRPGDPVTKDGANTYLQNLFFNPKRYELGVVGRYKLNKKLNLKTPENKTALTKEDIIASIQHLIKVSTGHQLVDDIDHLGNRRIRSVGELLQRQVRIGFARVERLIKEQMVIKGPTGVTPQNLINIRPLVAVIKEFFWE